MTRLKPLYVIALIAITSPLFLTALAGAQDADKMAREKEIRAEIDVLKRKIAGLERELAALVPAAPSKDVGPVRFKRSGDLYYDLAIGDKGHFGNWAYEVESVVDQKSAVLSVGRGSFRFLAVGVSTKGIVNRSKVNMVGAWEVTDTKNVRGTAMHVVEGKLGAALVKDNK